MNVPEYRVRLFLSVDLTGSTAYKHKNKNSLEWIKAFQTFYGQFPRMLAEQYTEAAKGQRGLTEHEKVYGHPKLWKTVGDEILFCCRLFSLCHLGVCVDAFIETLKLFGASARTYGLNTKGNAWVASFPTPNCSIMPVKIDNAVGDDALNGTGDIPTEEKEAKVDEDPSGFDFLGKGIDAGFRIAKNSAIDTLTLSPGLGILLSQAAGSHRVTGFSKKIRLVEMQVFKGVADSNPYPVLTIDTSRDERHEKLLEQQRKLLGHPQPPDNDELETYLKDFLRYHEIEIPTIKNTYNEENFTPPEFYTEYCNEWRREIDRIKAEDRRIEQAAIVNGEENGEVPVADVELQQVVDALPTM